MFLDTSGLLCYLDGAEAGHGESARRILSSPHLVTHSYVLMERRGLREGLTTDHHFEQEGFVRLLLPS